MSGMSGAPILSRKGVSTMLTGGAPGFTVSITTEGIKAVLEMFLTDRNIQFRVLICYLVSNVFYFLLIC